MKANGDYAKIRNKGIVKTVLSTVLLYALISVLRVGSPYWDLLMNRYVYLQALAYGGFACALAAVWFVYSALGARSWRPWTEEEKRLKRKEKRSLRTWKWWKKAQLPAGEASAAQAVDEENRPQLTASHEGPSATLKAAAAPAGTRRPTAEAARAVHRLFMYRGDFWALSVSAAVQLSYVLRPDWSNLGNGRILSGLFTITAGLALLGLLLFASTFSGWIRRRVYAAGERRKRLREQRQRAKQQTASAQPANGALPAGAPPEFAAALAQPASGALPAGASPEFAAASEQADGAAAAGTPGTPSTPTGSVLQERPIGKAAADLLKRGDLAAKLAGYLLSDRPAGLTIGILGKWGTGKSSLLKLVKDVIDKESRDDVGVMEFLPWYFGANDHDILQKFLLELSENIHQRYGYKPKLEKEIRQYAKLLAAVTYRPSVWNIAFKDVVDVLLPSEESKSLSSLKKEIEASLALLDKRYIVFIDELDRLDPREMQTIFKLVRLVADFPNITYVLALDDEFVSRSIQVMYEQDGERGEQAGKEFLEKFIQLPLVIPKAEPGGLLKLFMEGMEEIRSRHSIAQRLLYDDIESDLEQLGFTPRNVKRLLLTFEYYLLLFGEDVDRIDLLQLTMIQIRHSELYHFIYQRRDGFLYVSPAGLEELAADFKQLAGVERFYRLLAELFPESKQLFPDSRLLYGSGRTSHNLELEETKKIALPENFNRYFRHVLADDEIPELFMQQFVAEFAEAPDADKQYRTYLRCLKIYPLAIFHKVLRQRLAVQPDENLLLPLAELIVWHYGELFQPADGAEADKADLFQCELTLKIIGDKLPGQLLASDRFQMANLQLWANVLDHVVKHSSIYNIDSLPGTIERRLGIVTLAEMSRFSEGDARELYRFFYAHASRDELKFAVDRWLGDIGDLPKVLAFAVPSLQVLDTGDMQRLIRFSQELACLPASKIHQYYLQYNSRNRLPASLAAIAAQSFEEERYDSSALFLFYYREVFRQTESYLANALQRAKANGIAPPLDRWFAVVLQHLREFGRSPWLADLDNLWAQLEQFRAETVDD